MRTLYAVLVVAVVAGCASISPVVVQTGDSCYRCHRAIGETKLAAEIVDQSGTVMTSYPFRTSGCLAKYLKEHPPSNASTIFVTDYTTGRMFAAESGWFAPMTRMSADGKKVEKDYAVFRSESEAKAFASEGAPRRWAQVLADAVPD
jgi:hypothetical protein